MNEDLLRFKLLTHCENDENNTNLLEGTLFYTNAKIFISLLNEIDNKEVKYEVVSGFKGKTVFNDEENHFRSIVLSINDTAEMDLLQSIIESKFIDVLQYETKDNNIIEIELKDT